MGENGAYCGRYHESVTEIREVCGPLPDEVARAEHPAVGTVVENEGIVALEVLDARCAPRPIRCQDEVAGARPTSRHVLPG